MVRAYRCCTRQSHGTRRGCTAAPVKIRDRAICQAKDAANKADLAAPWPRYWAMEFLCMFITVPLFGCYR
jgi:hypothetical protein